MATEAMKPTWGTRLSVVTLAFALAASVQAQRCFYSYGSIPTEQAGENRYANLLPTAPASTGGRSRAQMAVSRFAFDNAPALITSLAVAPFHTEQVRYASLEIWMGYTSRRPLSAFFATNPTGSMTRVLDVRQHVWTCRTASWTEIGLQQPFLYVPAAGDLLIEVVTTRVDSGEDVAPLLVCNGTASEDTIVQRAFTGELPTTGAASNWVPKVRVCAESPSLDSFGAGCGSGLQPALGLTGSARLGQTATVWLSNAPAATASVLVLGVGNRAPTFPVDLAPLGMPGCKLYCSSDVGLTATTNALGIARAPLAVPSDETLVGSIVYQQFFVLDPGGNARGLTASNYGRILVGR